MKKIRAEVSRNIHAGGVSGYDVSKGTFDSEAQAVVWALNLVGYYNPVKSVVRTTLTNTKTRPEWSFFDASEKQVGFLFLDLE